YEPAFKPLQPWKGLRMICQGFKPDPGNLAVRHYRGASRNVRHGETVNPSCNRKSGNGNPSPTAGRARSLSQPWTMEKAKRARKAETLKQPSLSLRLRAPYLYPDHTRSGWCGAHARQSWSTGTGPAVARCPLGSGLRIRLSARISRLTVS